MKKKIYWLVESNGDLSNTVHSLTACQILIESDFGSLNDDEKEEAQYTITPTYLTEEEYAELPAD